jgi:hypothetical protein
MQDKDVFAKSFVSMSVPGKLYGAFYITYIVIWYNNYAISYNITKVIWLFVLYLFSGHKDDAVDIEVRSVKDK